MTKNSVLEFLVDTTLHFVCLQPQVHVAVSSMVDVVLEPEERER